jgi:(E)-4-hydroxy-3-methylbut-2-enyl-diphosphate synthase
MVNGPGEAREADIGIACGRGVGVLFKKGRPVRRIEEKKIVPEFIREVKRMVQLKAEKKRGPR